MNDGTFSSPYSPVAAGISGGQLAGYMAGGFIATFVAAASNAPLQVAMSGLVLAAVFWLLWREDDPPILLLPPLYQWSEVAIVPISTVWKDVPLNSLAMSGANLEASALYGFLGVLALSAGLRAGMGVLPGFNHILRLQTTFGDFGSVFRWSLLLMAAGYGFVAVSNIAGPARELFLQASNLKYVGIFMLAYCCLVNQRQLGLLALVVSFEVVIGMTGFFADFKNSLLALVIAALAARPKLTGKDLFSLGLAVGLLVGVAIFWSAVKGEYRQFVNQGTGEQVVLVPLSERVDFIVGKAVDFDGATAADGFDRLVSRHGYIDYLAQTMEFVPQGIAHENGALTLATLRHIMMPRFIFPGKPPLPSDTEVMALYTGQQMVWSGNTSISIGHLGELYVDFGYFGGLMGMFVIGLILGLVYRTIRNSPRSPPLLSAGLCLVAALPVAYFGTAYTKVVGAMIFSSIIALSFQRFVGPYFFPRPANVVPG